MQKRHYTNPVTGIKRNDCETLIKLALDEDAPEGDSTSESIFQENQKGLARIYAKESGTLCGLPVVEYVIQIYLEKTGNTVKLRQLFRDGQTFETGDVLFELEGSLISLFRLERIVLNFIQYLSGISTVTADAVLSAPENVIILDTRKTLPGYRRLAKYAVYCGGGSNHRIHLSDMALIKDNHIAAAQGPKKAIEAVRRNKPGIPVEIEVENFPQLDEALENHPDIIMLDNMNHEDLKKAFEIIQKCENPPQIEISGSMTPEKLEKLKEFGPMGVSMGYLTHTTRFLDISMEFTKLL